MIIESSNIKILELLVEKTESTFIELMISTELNHRQLLKAISDINYFFKLYQIDSFIINDNKIIKLQNSNNINIDKIKKHITLILSAEERINFIYCYIYGNKDEIINIDTLSTILSVSRNTIVNDLNQIRENLDTENIDILYSIKEGYYLAGNNFRMRVSFLKSYYFIHGASNVLLEYLLKSIKIQNVIKYKLKNSFRNLENNYFKSNNYFSNVEFSGLILLMSIILEKKDFLSTTEKIIMPDSNILELCQVYFADLIESEITFIALMLSSMNTQFENKIKRNDFSFKYSKIILERFNSLTGELIPNVDNLVYSIADQISIYLYKFDFSKGFSEVLYTDFNETLENLFMIVELFTSDLLKHFTDKSYVNLIKQISMILYCNFDFEKVLKKNNVAIYIPNSYTLSLYIKHHVMEFSKSFEANIISKRQLANGNFDILVTTINSTRIVKNISERAIILKPPVNRDSIKKINILLDEYNKENLKMRNRQAKEFNKKEIEAISLDEIFKYFKQQNRNFGIKITEIVFPAFENNKISNEIIKKLCIIYFTSGYGKMKYEINNTLFYLKNPLYSENCVEYVAFINCDSISNIIIGLNNLISIIS